MLLGAIFMSSPIGIALLIAMELANIACPRQREYSRELRHEKWRKRLTEKD